MAHEGPEDEQESNKGRTVFGIGLPASVQAATKSGPAPMPRAPARAPAKAPAKASAKPAPDPLAAQSRPGHAPTEDDLRAPAGHDDSAHTLHALPSQLIGAVTGRTLPPARSPERGDDKELRRPQTGDYSATTPDLSQRSARVASQPGEAEGGPSFEKAHTRLVAGKPIPGTRYRLLRWLGEGGMGVVYEAEHIDIERRVALKILRAELSERSDTAQVFREEARAAARAGSKNNVEIFDFGELPDGRLFFCMELLNGIDLSTLTENPLDPGRTFAILRQICKGLGAAHKAGVIHRDIKPENIILVQSEGRRDMVKIVDFGVAAILDARREAGRTIAGTPQYMPPEQISGADFDARLDIYAVGCVAYEMLVQHPPFTMENLADLLLAQINTVPPRPSAVRPDAGPKALEEVVMRCLEKDPSKRYENMADLEASLCEAQIAAGVISEWDDLPLPDVDPDRRANLLARMPSLHAEPPRRRWVGPVIAAVTAATLTGLALLILGSPEVPPEVAEQIDTLSAEAREAAAVGHYVLAPEKEEAVAIKKVYALEGIEGPGEALADKTAGVLRKEFSTQLLTVADKFWNQDATRPLAYDYYDWVLWFDPDNALALERTVRTAKERTDMLDRTIHDQLRESDLAGMTIASAAVATGEKRNKWARQLAMNRMPLSKSIEAQEAMRGAGLAPPEPEAAPAPKVDEKPATPPPPEPDPDAIIEVPDDPEPTPTEAGKKAGSKGKKRGDADADPADGEVKRDPAKASELASQGSAALSAGRRAEAEALFNQAISFDRRNGAALIGLSDIYFDRGSSTKAQKYAEQAVAVAPTNSSYRIKLGDAYFNALRYRDALTHYEKAQQLGDAKAGPRIARVKSKLGE
ncbi:MAG TPA: protein kinase [Nannocystis sp.]